MSQYTVEICDLCNKQLDPNSLEHLQTIVINHYYRKTYQIYEEEHFRVEIEICNDCTRKYKLCDYQRKNEAVNFIKEQHGFLSVLWKKVIGRKQDRTKLEAKNEI